MALIEDLSNKVGLDELETFFSQSPDLNYGKVDRFTFFSVSTDEELPRLGVLARFFDIQIIGHTLVVADLTDEQLANLKSFLTSGEAEALLKAF